MEYTKKKSLRINEIDFMESVFIMLMKAFHIVHRIDLYPYDKRFADTFHKPELLSDDNFVEVVIIKNNKNAEKTIESQAIFL